MHQERYPAPHALTRTPHTLTCAYTLPTHTHTLHTHAYTFHTCSHALHTLSHMLTSSPHTPGIQPPSRQRHGPQLFCQADFSAWPDTLTHCWMCPSHQWASTPGHSPGCSVPTRVGSPTGALRARTFHVPTALRRLCVLCWQSLTQLPHGELTPALIPHSPGARAASLQSQLRGFWGGRVEGNARRSQGGQAHQAGYKSHVSHAGHERCPLSSLP